MTVRGVRSSCDTSIRKCLEVVDFLYLLIGILQCLQHSVNGIGQAANFIGVPPRRETTGVVFRDRNLGGSGSQVLKGKHCPVHQQPDHQSRQSECYDDPWIEKVTQLVQCMIDGLGGAGHDDISQQPMVDRHRLAVHEERHVAYRHLFHLVSCDGVTQQGQRTLPEIARTGQHAPMLI